MALEQLSPRELQITLLVAEHGMKTKEIAELLGVSPRTVESHRLNALNKLKIKGAMALARLVLAERPPPPPIAVDHLEDPDDASG